MVLLFPYVTLSSPLISYRTDWRFTAVLAPRAVGTKPSLPTRGRHDTFFTVFLIFFPGGIERGHPCEPRIGNVGAVTLLGGARIVTHRPAKERVYPHRQGFSSDYVHCDYWYPTRKATRFKLTLARRLGVNSSVEIRTAMRPPSLCGSGTHISLACKGLSVE